MSPSPNFAPTTATQIAEVQAASNFVFAQLTANTTYFTKVVALDNNNNTAISNELSFTTAQAAAIRTAKPVQVIAPNINTRAETNQLIFNTAELTETIQTNQILVAKTDQGGHLRTVTNVIDSNGQTTVTTAPASLADVFEQVSFSTEAVFASPAAAPVTAAAAGTARTPMKSFALGHRPQVQRRYSVDSNNKVQIEKRQSWQQTGFTLIEDITPKNQIKGTHKVARQVAKVALKNENNTVTAGGNLSITGAKIVVLNPDDQLHYQVYAKVRDHNGEIKLKSFKLRHLKHDDKKSRNNFGATSTLSTTETSGARPLKKQLTLNWVPNASHVSNKPYIATFRAVENRDKGIDDSLEYQVHIIVTNDSTEIAPDENRRFSGTSTDNNLTLNANMSIGFEPSIKVSGDFGLSGLNTAEVIASGTLRLNQNINLSALANARLEGETPKFINKSFIKVVMAGKVPVVITGQFTIHAEFTASTTTALQVSHQFDATYDIKVGVRYNNGVWTPYKTTTPTFEYELMGEVGGEVFGEVRLVPTLTISIYETAYGKLKIEPYLNAAVGVEGQFKYTKDHTPTTDFNTDWNADYRFTQLNMKGGVDVRIRMGLDIFSKEGYDLVGFPSRDQLIFAEFQPINNRTIFGLPVMTVPTINTTPDNVKDSRSILLTTTISDIEHPLVSSLGSLNPFQRDSLHWSALQSATVSFSHPNINDKTQVLMTYTEATKVEVKVSGHSKLGRLIRQHQTITIDLADHNGNQISDHWETTHNLVSTNNAADPDNDGATNLQEFLHGSFPNRADSDNDRIKDGWEISHNINPLHNDANADPDADGYSNLQEYNAGTDPNLAGSNPGVPVPDNTAPIITLNGSNPLSIVQNASSSYIDAGASATDAVDGVVSVITTENTVDIATVGTYTVSYSATDAAGNVATATRIVNVVGQQIIATGKLNDTGITWGGNFPSGNNTTCIGETIGEQDCSHGRDAQALAGTLTKVGAGHAGFDFTKLDATGNPLADQTQSYATNSWQCVKDNHTGLVWEVKTPAGSGGIHDANNRYRWGGKTAQLTADFGRRFDGWNTLVDGSNAAGLCGFTDWRVPGKEELRSIVNYNKVNPTIDSDYFPNTLSGWYWSSSPYAGHSHNAWIVHFHHGHDNALFRSSSSHVRLVRGGQ